MSTITASRSQTNDAQKVKLNLYISEESRDLFDELVYEIKRLMPRELKSRVNNSTVAEAALNFAINDVQKDKTVSAFLEQFLKSIREERNLSE